LLAVGVERALARCAEVYDPQLDVECKYKTRYGSSLSQVDTAIFVNNVHHILQEAKSPTVMEAIRNILPHHGVDLRWATGGTLLMKVFLKVTYLHTHPKLADQERRSGCCLPWFATARMAVFDLPQFLDRIPFDEDR
jgi:hypothetical protein